MSNRGAFLSSEIRRITKWSQQTLADRLFVSRNYIALIEGEKKTPSVRLLSRLEAFYEAANKGNIDGVQEEGVPYGVRSPAEILTRYAREHFEELLKSAEGNVERLAWLVEQMKSHLAVPHHWEASASAREKLEGFKRRAAAELDQTPAPPQRKTS